MGQVERGEINESLSEYEGIGEIGSSGMKLE
jgi:hypothetical protein